MHKKGVRNLFSPRARRAFTLLESLLAITLTAVAGLTLLAGIASSIQTTDAALEQAIALGMAQQLMDEVAGWAYMQPGVTPYQFPLGPGPGEGGPTRANLNDIDDFHGFVEQPPSDRWGIPLGTDNGQGGQRYANMRCRPGYFDGWRREIEVYYVSDADPSTRLFGSQTSNHRAVEVRVYIDEPTGGARELVRLRRVFAYVPQP